MSARKDVVAPDARAAPDVFLHRAIAVAALLWLVGITATFLAVLSPW